MADKLECFSPLLIVDQKVSVDKADARKCQNEDDKMSPDQFEDTSVPHQYPIRDTDERILGILVSTGVDVGMAIVHCTCRH